MQVHSALPWEFLLRVRSYCSGAIDPSHVGLVRAGHRTRASLAGASDLPEEAIGGRKAHPGLKWIFSYSTWFMRRLRSTAT